MSPGDHLQTSSIVFITVDSFVTPQVTEVRDLESRLFTALEATPPAGKQFAAAIRTALKHEEWWVEWKRGGCTVRGAVASESA